MKKEELKTKTPDEAQFVRLFNSVRRCTEINSNSKLVLSLIISYQLQGNDFYMSNERIGYECGFSEATAARSIKNLLPYLNKQKEYVQPDGEGKVKTIRYLSVKDLSKWVSSSVLPSNVTTENKSTSNAVVKDEVTTDEVKLEVVKPKPNKFSFIKTKNLQELNDWADSVFSNKDELKAFLNSNENALNHFDKLLSSNL